MEYIVIVCMLKNGTKRKEPDKKKKLIVRLIRLHYQYTASALLPPMPLLLTCKILTVGRSLFAKSSIYDHN